MGSLEVPTLSPLLWGGEREGTGAVKPGIVLSPPLEPSCRELELAFQCAWAPLGWGCGCWAGLGSLMLLMWGLQGL